MSTLASILRSLAAAAFIALSAMGLLWLIGAAFGWIVLGFRMVAG